MRYVRSRRDVLRSLTAGIATLPFLRLVEGSYAQAEGAPLPQRFIGVYHPHGIAAEHFTRRPGETETEFELGYENSPLQPFDDAATYGRSFKDKLIVIEGLTLLSDTNAHNSAATILTGSRVVGGSGGRPENSSLDQFLAIEHGLGEATPVPSVALAVGNNELSARATLSFGARGVPVSKLIDPALTFDFLFKRAMLGTNAEAKAAARQRKLGQSLLDFVRGDVNRLRARLGPFELQKLDQHLDSLRALEKKVNTSLDAKGCPLPSRPLPFPRLEEHNGGEPYFDEITNLHIDLLALAMGCDITRFATLGLNDLSYAENPLGLPADNHAAVAHTYAARTPGSPGQAPRDGDPASWRRLARFNRYAYGKVARLLQRLNEASILDSTLVYASSDMGNPALHSTTNVPTVLAGGVSGKLRMGRRLALAPDCCAGPDAESRGVTNNRLLVSLARLFGVEIDSYGSQPDVRDATGALPGV